MKKLQKQIDNKLQMTCKQISDLTGIRHDNVKRAIDSLVKSGVIESPQTEVIKTRTRPRTDYVFYGDQGERDSVIVIAQVSPLSGYLTYPSPSPNLPALTSGFFYK